MIALLSSDHYLTPLRRWREGAHFTHLARVDFDGETATSFVKIYPPGTGGVFGEALGYLASVELGLPRAPHAAVIRLPVSRLKGLDAPDWLKQCGDSVWAWCCERIPGRTLAQFYTLEDEADPAYAALLKTIHGPGIAAIDETFSNGDRNGGSFVRVSSKSWAVIDFGECLGSHCWPQTGPYDVGLTFLVKAAERLLAADHRKVMQSKAIDAAHRLAIALPKWKPLLIELMDELQVGAAANKVIPFLDDRTHVAWMPKRLGWLA